MDALGLDDGLELSANGEVSSTVMRKMGICYKIAKLMQTNERSCLLERGLTNTDRHKKAAALQSLIQELTVLTGQHFTEKQITKCLSNMRNRLKERTSLSGIIYAERLGGWERELLTVYQQGGLMNDLRNDDSPKKTRKKSGLRSGGPCKHSVLNGLPTQVQRASTLNGLLRSSMRNGILQSTRNCVPNNTYKVSGPRFAFAKTASARSISKQPAAKQNATRSVPIFGSGLADKDAPNSIGCQQNIPRLLGEISPPSSAEATTSSSSNQEHDHQPASIDRGLPPFTDSDSDVKPFSVPQIDACSATMDNISQNHNVMELSASDTETDARSDGLCRPVLNSTRQISNHHSDDHSKPAIDTALSVIATASLSTSLSTLPRLDHPTPTTSASPIIATGTRPAGGNPVAHFDFESDETSRLSNEQLHRLVLLEQLTYVRLKRNLFTQRFIVDTSQHLLVHDRQPEDSATSSRM